MKLLSFSSTEIGAHLAPAQEAAVVRAWRAKQGAVAQPLPPQRTNIAPALVSGLAVVLGATYSYWKNARRKA